MLWLKKLLAVVLISSGISLICIHFPQSLSGERTTDVVNLRTQAAPFTAKTAASASNGTLVHLSYKDLIAFPHLQETVLRLMGRSGYGCLPAPEWDSFLKALSISTADNLAYTFREGLYVLKGRETARDEYGQPLVCLDVAILGAYDNPEWRKIPRIAPEDLKQFPQLQNALLDLTAREVPFQDRVRVPPDQWRSFQRRVLNPDEHHPSFVFSDRLIAGGIEQALVPWSFQTPWLRNTARGAGMILVLLGMIMLIRTYRASKSRPGIPIASSWFAFFCDALLIGSGIFCISLALDSLWLSGLGQKSLLGLDPEWPSYQTITALHFVANLGLFVGLPLLTLIFTSLSAQRIAVDGNGVTSYGAIGASSISWPDLEKVTVREQKNPVAFAVMDFRSLQRVVDLEGSESEITINEPTSRQRKQALRDALRLHAPDAKRDMIKALETW